MPRATGRLPLCTNCREVVRLLKKSLSARSVVQKRPKTR